MELSQRDLKSDLGLGEYQVSGEEGRIEHAVASLCWRICC